MFGGEEWEAYHHGQPQEYRGHQSDRHEVHPDLHKGYLNADSKSRLTIYAFAGIQYHWYRNISSLNIYSGSYVVIRRMYKRKRFGSGLIISSNNTIG